MIRDAGARTKLMRMLLAQIVTLWQLALRFVEVELVWRTLRFLRGGPRALAQNAT